MDTLEAAQTLREVMPGENPVSTQHQRMANTQPDITQPQRVEKAEPRTVVSATKTWYQLDRDAIAFLTTKAGGLL